MLLCQHSFRWNRARHSGRQPLRGVSLAELLVVMGLLTLIFGVLISLTTQSSALVSQGTQVIALNQKARSAIDAMGPYLVSAVNDAGSPALVSPAEKKDAPTAEELATYTSIKFTTTEDYLDDDYNPKADWDTGLREVFHYEIYFNDTTNPLTYKLENGTTINLGRILLRRYTDPSFTTVDTTVGEKALAVNVQFFYCHRLRADSLEAKVHTVGKRKGPAGNQIDVFEQATGILSIPSPSYL